MTRPVFICFNQRIWYETVGRGVAVKNNLICCGFLDEQRLQVSAFSGSGKHTANELAGKLESQIPVLLEFALTVTRAQIIINFQWFTTEFPFISQINRATGSSSALPSDAGLWRSRAAGWPGLQRGCRVIWKVTGLYLSIRPKCPWASCLTTPHPPHPHSPPLPVLWRNTLLWFQGMI